MTPRQQLETFIAKYSPEMARQGRAALKALRRFLPGATEMVYDNYVGLVVGFGPTERPSDAVFSLLFTPRWLTLCFLQNAPELPDPERLLKGHGNVIRHVRLASPTDLEAPAVRALMQAAVDRDWKPRTTGRGRVVIRLISKKQRPRRTAGAEPTVPRFSSS